MRFWDASAIVPLVVKEASSPSIRGQYQFDATMEVWWGSSVECVSALARRNRQGELQGGLETALGRLRILIANWHEVPPGDEVRDTAQRLLQAHDLRAADALQLAAALQAAEGHPITLDFVCLDSRLAAAAAREGFTVVGADS